MYSTLISTAELASQLFADNPLSIENWVIVDCRFDLARPAAGQVAYAEAHIPGAVYADLNTDLSTAINAHSGRHPLPEPTSLARRLGDWGIDNDTQVIAYDADNGAFAARLWWLLRWLGHRRAAVLDGGFGAWTAAELPVSRDPPRPRRRFFQPHVAADLTVDAAQVAQYVRDPDWRVLDARAPERYAGSVEPLDAVAGHIPGAHSHPLSRNLAAAHFLPAAELRQRFEQTLGAVRSDQVIAMCGSGVTACHTLLAMEIAGLHGARLYPGSWSEWIRDPARPVAKGLQP